MGKLLDSFEEFTDLSVTDSPSVRLGKIAGVTLLGVAAASIVVAGAYLMATTPAVFEVGQNAGPIMHIIERGAAIGTKLELGLLGATVASLPVPIVVEIGADITKGAVSGTQFVTNRLRTMFSRNDSSNTPQPNR